MHQATIKEKMILRELARRVMEIASLPEQAEKRKRWIAHNGLRGARPMIICFPEGVWLQCVPNETIQCADPMLSGWEKRLRMAIYTHEAIGDDQVIDPVFNVGIYAPPSAGDGIKAPDRSPEEEQAWAPDNLYYLHHTGDLAAPSHLRVGALQLKFKDPADIDKHIEKLKSSFIEINNDEHSRQIEITMAYSRQCLALANDLFGDILPVRQRPSGWYGFSPVPAAVNLCGTEQLMLDMLDRPEWVHKLVRCLTDQAIACLDRQEADGLFYLNNTAEWVGTGGIGYTDELPAPGFRPERVRAMDVWGVSQSQDLVGISPAMLDEFFMPSIIRVMERFGLNCYGCCEPVHDRLDIIRKIPRLRRLSISPWANVKICAEKLGGACVFSYKPHPGALAADQFDERAIRTLLTESLAITKANGCIVEVIMKDLHNVQNEPARIRRWVEIAKQVRAEVYG